jgi:hypothetical protein
VKRSALVAASLIALLVPRIAEADSPIQTIVAKVPAPVAGTTETLQIGLTSVDGSTWDPQSYTTALVATDANGRQVATSDAAPGTTAIAPGQTAFVFADIALPANVTGALTITATIAHNGATFTSQPVSIGVSSNTAPPGPPKPSPFSGKISSTEALKPPLGSDNTANLTYKDGNRSYTASDEYSTTPGAQPLLQIQGPATMTQVGTFSPAFDPEVFGGVNGQGASWMRNWGSTRELQATYVAAGQATTNPFEVTAASYMMPLRAHSTLTFTGAVEHTSGLIPAATISVPGQSGGNSGQPFFMESGEVAGLTLQEQSQTGITYSAHYAVADYFDALALMDRTASAFASQASFTWAKINWTVNYARAGTYFPTLTAPGVTPDKELESLSGAFSLGAIKGTLGINGYRTDIDAVIPEDDSHFWTETLALSTTLKRGDQVALNLTNGTLHEIGDPTALMQGNDAQALTWSIPRGKYSYQLSYSSAEQRDDEGNLTHTVQEGITVGRNASPGLSATLGINFNEIGASMAQAGSFSTSANGSLTYVQGTLSLSAAYTRTLTLPNFGDATLPGQTITYGIQDQPKHLPFGFSAGMTRNIGLASYTVGTFGLVRTF